MSADRKAAAWIGVLYIVGTVGMVLSVVVANGVLSGPVIMLLTTFEILLTIVTPLIVLYVRGRWSLRIVTACLCGLPVVWYLTYAPMIIGSAALWSFLLVSLALCLLSNVVILRRYAGFPEPLPANGG